MRTKQTPEEAIDKGADLIQEQGKHLEIPWNRYMDLDSIKYSSNGISFVKTLMETKVDFLDEMTPFGIKLISDITTFQILHG